jgi:chromosome segregation ATPase
MTRKKKNIIQPEQPPIQYQPSIVMGLVNMCEYQNVIKENIELRSQIIQLSNNERVLISNEKLLNETISANKKTIEELQKENKELRKRVGHLESQLKLVISENTELRKENNELKNEVSELRTEVIGLRKDYAALREDNVAILTKLNNMTLSRMYERYIVAIQDFNSREKLETQIYDADVCDELRDLRTDRVGNCHYIDNVHDSDEYINAKFTILAEKLKNMPIELYNEFEDVYPNLISTVAQYANVYNTTPNKTQSAKINRWWNA